MDKAKLQTTEFIYGSWKSIPSKVYNNYNGIMSIDKEKVALKMFVNDERKHNLRFDATTRWEEDYLCFAGDARFYVLSANETEMIFGEFKTEGNREKGKKWELKFQRVV